MSTTRREFSAQVLGSLMTYGLIETLWSRRLFADAVTPMITAWMKELAAMTRDLRGQKLTGLQFQAKMEDLYRRVDLKALLSLVRFEDVERRAMLPDNGAHSSGADLTTVEGLPVRAPHRSLGRG